MNRLPSGNSSCSTSANPNGIPSIEPSIDYVVTKIPRFAFEKFPQADPTLTTQMKRVGGLPMSEYALVSRILLRRRFGFDIIVAERDSQLYRTYFNFFSHVRENPEVRKGLLRVTP